MAAANEEQIISMDHVTYANTILHYTEHFMPKALGEFGKARNSDVTSKMLEMIERAERPLHPIKDIWPAVQRDLDSQRQMVEILGGLKSAGKIQQLIDGILPYKKPPKWDFPHCKIGLLREYVDKQMRDGLAI